MPCFRLKEMIVSKYGKNKFDTGKLLVAKWLSKETGIPVDAEAVQQCCDAEDVHEFYVSPMMFNALQKLFGFKLPEEFFTAKASETEKFLIVQ